MDPDNDSAFLRDLVKASRQKIHLVKWVDRDGTARLTALSLPEMTRLNALARAQGVSPGERLRRAAHIPVAKPPRGEVSSAGLPAPASD